MARNNKTGLDYFSHDTDMSNDIKLKFIKAKYGLIGYAVYNKLLEQIYREKGYYLEINDRYLILFSDENNIELNVCKEIINDCINEKLFDINLYNVYSILTSRRVQENYLRGSERRKNITLFKEYLLLVPSEILKENQTAHIIIINVSINKDNVNINSQNAGINSQSKVKESKLKGNKKKENILPEKTPAKNLQNELRLIFEDYYLQLKQIPYHYNGKDAGALKQLINKLKFLLKPEMKNDEGVINGFKYMLSNLNDDWVLQNLDLPNINSKFQQIIDKIKNGKPKSGYTKGFDLKANDWYDGDVYSRT